MYLLLVILYIEKTRFNVNYHQKTLCWFRIWYNPSSHASTNTSWIVFLNSYFPRLDLYKQLSIQDKNQFITLLIQSSTPPALSFIHNSCLPLLRRDYISYLPVELSFQILFFRDNYISVIFFTINPCK